MPQSIPGAPAHDRASGARRTSSRRATSGSLGDFGLSARWSPAWLDGTLGFYGRNTTDILPQLILTPGLATTVPAAVCTAIGGNRLGGTNCIINKNATTVADLQKFGKVGTYNTAYGDNIHIYGLTLAKEIAGVSWAAEISYRQNMPLLSQAVQVLPAALVPTKPGSIATTAVPSSGTPGALGDTYPRPHQWGQRLPEDARCSTRRRSPGELTWMQWSKVTQNEAVFKGDASYVNADGSTPIDKVTKNYFGLAINFTPTWFQVFPGVDLSAPMTWSQGISGNAAVLLGGNKDAGNWSRRRRRGHLSEVQGTAQLQRLFRQLLDDTDRGAEPAPTARSPSLSDRGWVSLTFKTTF